jgi:cytochrome c oxidase assembly protein subunit 15
VTVGHAENLNPNLLIRNLLTIQRVLPRRPVNAPSARRPLRSQVLSFTVFNRAHHRFLTFAACVTFFLIIAGALVTSNDAGLAVPDWPTSFGSLYHIPPMVGGVKFEHGHRMLAEFVGFLTIIIALWTWRAEQRSWMRKLGVAALGTVIAQGILGGITVLYYLPPPISSAHATLAQTFFCILVSMAVVTGHNWTQTAPEIVSENRRPHLRTLAVLSVAAVYVQLILGAAFRHSGLKLLPHLISAVVVTVVLLWTTTRVLSQHSNVPQLRRPALMLLVLLVLQLSLGFVAYLSRVVWSVDAPQPLFSMVVATVSHVAVGALVLASSVVLALQTFRHTAAKPVRAVTRATRADKVVAA